VSEIEAAGGKADAIAMNIREPEAVDAAIAEMVERCGRLDAVVNNAGGQFPAPAGELKRKGWLAVVDTNLNGTWWVSQAAYRHALRDHGGAIVNIVADVWMGAPGMVHTGAARAGVINMTTTLAAEWAPAGVRVNAVAPGPILSSGLATYPKDIQQRTLDEVRITPPSRLGTESEVSAAITFLLSPAAGYITGETVKIDGGSQFQKGRLIRVGHHKKSKPFDAFHLKPDFTGTPFQELYED